MPEELLIAVVILIGVVWLVVKICQGIAAFLDQVSKSYSEAAATRRRTRYSKAQDGRRPYVRTAIPNELDGFEKTYERLSADLKQSRRTTKWTARPPAWTNEKFQAVRLPRKDAGCREMCIDEIDAILAPNSDSTTWANEELEVINRQCKYPAGPPASKPEQFTEFPSIGIDLEEAVFEVDESHISRKDVDRYFADDRDKVSAYNNRRADLLTKASNLNAAIKEWNQESRVSWERYVAALKQVAEAEYRAFQNAVELYINACQKEQSYFQHLFEGYKEGTKQCVIERLGFVLDRITFPRSVPHIWDVDFDEEQRIAVIDMGLPDVVHHPPYKTVTLKSGSVKKPLNQTERKELIPKVHPAILLRAAYEIFRNDISDSVNLLVLNGWVSFDDPATGVNTKAYTASLMIERGQITGLNLAKIDPIIAFNNLHGKSAGKLVEIIPIEPVLSLNRRDSRFVNAKEVLSGLGTETNLAAMDWQDFEHLIRELFEKEFSGRGAEVKITQASRDRGVDAVVFDPDPIHGGKYVIQAKRYTHTVDVSAVRDLCAVVKKEGASRGILVTTSTYGADAYAFANNEPVTLLNGAELLGLLKKHGYAFRINLQEARRTVSPVQR